MDIVLNLDPETERLVREEAARRGIAPERVAEDIVAEGVARQKSAQKAGALRAMFDDWDRDADPNDDTFETIVKALNEERKGYRQLYPPELKGKTW